MNIFQSEEASKATFQNSKNSGPAVRVNAVVM